MSSLVRDSKCWKCHDAFLDALPGNFNARLGEGPMWQKLPFIYVFLRFVVHLRIGILTPLLDTEVKGFEVASF